MNDMKDLTVLFLTVNKVPEKWAEYHRKILLEAIGDYPLITISRKPMDLGINLIQDEGQTHSNIYWQMLRGAKLATTPYIAVAEDDSLYSKDHFSSFRPPLDTFAYNMNRWSLYTWGAPIYSMKPTRKSNSTFIGPRELIIEALEERFKKFPNGIPHQLCGELGFERIERNLGVTERKAVDFFSYTPVIQFNHYCGVWGNAPGYDPKTIDDHIKRLHKKTHGRIQAYDIPHWGRAEDLRKHFI